MQNAVKNTEALVVVSQENMLEKLKHSEVATPICKVWLNLIKRCSGCCFTDNFAEVRTLLCKQII